MSGFELAQRNIRALEEAAKQDRERADSIQTELRAAQTAIASLTAELNSLRVQVITLLARSGGTGATSR